jgi:hypothetical protein
MILAWACEISCNLSATLDDKAPRTCATGWFFFSAARDKCLGKKGEALIERRR